MTGHHACPLAAMNWVTVSSCMGKHVPLSTYQRPLFRVTFYSVPFTSFPKGESPSSIGIVKKQAQEVSAQSTSLKLSGNRKVLSLWCGQISGFTALPWGAG